MEYTKTVWKDLPDTTTPITASRLNNIENGIEYLFEHGVGGGDTLPIGIILPFSDDTIPEGYMLCDGRAISRTTYSRLFSVIGTTYGAGDGTTTFNLPNLKGKVPVGYDSTDSDFDTLGETGGEKEHMHYNGMSAYNNQLTVSNTNSDSSHSADELYTVTGTNGFNGVGTQNVYAYSTESGSSLQPYQVVNYIIKVSQTTSTQAQVVDGYSTSTTDSYSCNYVNGIIENGNNTNGKYTKFLDGTLICYGKSSDITTAAKAGTQATITLPQQFIDANYVVTVTPTYPTAYWGEVLFSTTDFTTSSFKISTWNSGSYTNTNQVFNYIAIGKWK